jgi:putative nucleotidyltransferase with HDIG domain
VAKCLRQDGEMAFSAGLLHDIGIMVLDVCDHERFAAMWQSTQAGEDGLIEAERAALGFDHAELGAEVARRWKFPPAIEEAIRSHYQNEHSYFQMLTGIVQLAALLARFSEEETPAGEWFDRIPASLRDALQLDRERLEKCLPPPEQVEAAKNQMLG